MSLDICLKSKNKTECTCICDQCGHIHDSIIYPDYAHFNITHNLVLIAKRVSIYEYFWNPALNGVIYAKDLIDPINLSIKALEEDPKGLKALNPTNGWGTYKGFMALLHKILSSCIEFPEAVIEIDK